MNSPHLDMRGTGIYIPDDEHIAIVRAWLADHPRTRDPGVIAARLRLAVRGLRSQDLPELFLAATGCDLRQPAEWPAEWPVEWPDIAAQVKAQAQADAQAKAVRKALAKAKPVPSSALAVPRAVEGAPVAGTPGAAGLPVRALRVPLHLRPGGYGRASPLGLAVAQAMLQARRAGQALTREELAERVATTRWGIATTLEALRSAGIVASGYDMPRHPARQTMRGAQPNYAYGLTPVGVVVARAVPSPLDRAEDKEHARADGLDMEVLDYLRRQHLDGAEWVPAAHLAAREGWAEVPGTALPRLQASGVVERARLAAPGGPTGVRLAPAVQVAWGCVPAGGAL
jgi:hypothetical protein